MEIAFMLDSKRNSSDAPKEKSEEAKRTTIILEKSEREFIEQLIKDGKEPGIKPLISKMLDIYKSMMIYDSALSRRILLWNKPHRLRKR